LHTHTHTYTHTGIPVALRLVYRKDFTPGPFYLGAFSYPVAVGAVAWIAFISIAFILPQLNPVTSETLNYSIVAVGIVLTYCLGFWLLSARRWYVVFKYTPPRCIGLRGQSNRLRVSGLDFQF
jgi:hypothetical protein